MMDKGPERPRLQFEPGDGIEEANKAVAGVLSALAEAGNVPIDQLSAEKRQEYAKLVCCLVATGIATMPCVQKAMGIAHPELDARDRFAMFVGAVVFCFGLQADKEEEPNYFRPANPLFN